MAAAPTLLSLGTAALLVITVWLGEKNPAKNQKNETINSAFSKIFLAIMVKKTPNIYGTNSLLHIYLHKQPQHIFLHLLQSLLSQALGQSPQDVPDL